MPRLSKEQREEAYELVKNGVNLTEIAKQMKTNRSTITRLIKRITEIGTTDDRPRPGRPRVMPTKDTWLECSGSERPFVCRECAKTFKTFSNLKGHMKIHSETPLFHCDQCARGFVSLSGLERHMRCHTGEKPYICEYCARGFADISTMKTHIRYHTGERPFKCHLCTHACSTAGNLHHHMKVHKDKDGVVPKPINVHPSKSNAIPIFDYNSFLLEPKCESEPDPITNGDGGRVAKSQKTLWKEQHESDVSELLMKTDKMEEEDMEDEQKEEEEDESKKKPPDGPGNSEDVEDKRQDKGGRLESEQDGGEGGDTSGESVKSFMVVVPSLSESDGKDLSEIKNEPGDGSKESPIESNGISIDCQMLTGHCEDYLENKIKEEEN